MKIIRKYQDGGNMPSQENAQSQAPQGGAPDQGGQEQGGNPEEQLMQIADQIIQQFGPDGAAALAQMIMQIIQQGAQQQQPTFARRGGTLVRKS